MPTAGPFYRCSRFAVRRIFRKRQSEKRKKSVEDILGECPLSEGKPRTFDGYRRVFVHFGQFAPSKRRLPPRALSITISCARASGFGYAKSGNEWTSPHQRNEYERIDGSANSRVHRAIQSRSELADFPKANRSKAFDTG